jgi:DNA repair photolyase
MNIKYINLLQKIVKIKEINAKTILRKHKKIDSWFVSRYGMNLYRGCTHNCVYCDGRAEKYNVEGSFGDEVTVKVNAIELLKKELEPKRKPLDPGYMLIGGGVGDSYQPVEKQYKLTRRVLELLSEKDFPVHVLTKSVLVERDVDILKKINEKTMAIVSFSFSSADDKISEIFEPGVPPPSERLETIKHLKDEGFSCGMYLMPVIPFISDKSPIMDFTLSEAKRVGVDFVVFSGMTLKDGRQREYFDNVLVKNYPELVVNYNHIYRGDKWGSAIGEYYDSIHKTFSNVSRKYRLPVRMPSKLFKNYLKQDDLVIVLLEQIDYMLKLQGKKSPYGFAAYSISKLQQPLSGMRNNLQKLKGVGPTTERIILEILDTGTSSYYEKLINQ